MITAVFATGCWIFIAMLHYGMGYKYFTAAKAKTGTVARFMHFAFAFVFVIQSN